LSPKDSTREVRNLLGSGYPPLEVVALRPIRGFATADSTHRPFTNIGHDLYRQSLPSMTTRKAGGFSSWSKPLVHKLQGIPRFLDHAKTELLL